MFYFSKLQIFKVILVFTVRQANGKSESQILALLKSFKNFEVFDQFRENVSGRLDFLRRNTAAIKMHFCCIVLLNYIKLIKYAHSMYISMACILILLQRSLLRPGLDEGRHGKFHHPADPPLHTETVGTL